MSAIDIPAIRGTIGKLTYYTATFTFKQIADRVKPANEELHTSKPLREHLQRALFQNREGLLPKKAGRTWTECDINTWGRSQRGAERIVFSNDGLVYYTANHYASFELLYGEP